MSVVSYNYTMRFIGLRFYSNSLIHILSLSKSQNNVASLQKNRGDKSHHVFVVLVFDGIRHKLSQHKLTSSHHDEIISGFAVFFMIFYRCDLSIYRLVFSEVFSGSWTQKQCEFSRTSQKKIK